MRLGVLLLGQMALYAAGCLGQFNKALLDIATLLVEAQEWLFKKSTRLRDWAVRRIE